MRAENLFGQDGDERLKNSLAEAVDDWIDSHDPDAGERAFEVVEWSARPLSAALPSAGRVLTWIDETFCDDVMFEEAGDLMAEAVNDPTVIAAAERLMARIGERLGTAWRVADREITRHQFTLDEHGEPMLNGERFYR